MICLLAEETQVQDPEELSTTGSESQANIPYRLQNHKMAVHLEYVIFMENTVAGNCSTRRSQPTPNKQWTCKMAKPPPPAWRQNLSKLNWLQFQSGIMRHLGTTLDYLETFLKKLNNSHRIHWIAMISGNSAYSIKKAAEITKKREYNTFVTEALRAYPSKVIIRLMMDDPHKIIKSWANVSVFFIEVVMISHPV
jgi:hypothetical protein